MNFKFTWLLLVLMMGMLYKGYAQPSSCDNDPLARPMITATNNGVICNGNPITLSITSQPGGPLPSWNNIQWYVNGGIIPSSQGGTSSSITVRFPGAIYEVRASNQECMSTTQYQSAPFTPTASPASTASISGNLRVPPGGTTTLTANPSGQSYSWSTGATSQAINVGAGTYSVTVTDANGCSNTVSATVTEDASCSPAVTVSNGGVLCNANAVTLSLTNLPDATAWQWFHDGVTVPGATSSTYTTSTAGSYTLQVTSPSCGTVTSGPVSVNASSITAGITGNTTVATGGTTTLTATPAGMGYVWSNGASTSVSASAALVMLA